MKTELSARELQVMRMVVAGTRNCDIASQLGISQKTVQAHKWHVRGKLGVTGTYAELLNATRHYLDQLTDPAVSTPLETAAEPAVPSAAGVSQGEA